MENQLIFILISLIVLIVLIIIYYTQARNKKITSIIYRILLYGELFACITDFGIYYLIPLVKDNSILCNLVIKSHWIIGFLLFSALYFYITGYTQEDKDITLKNLIKTTWKLPTTIIGVIALIMFIILPGEYMDENGYVMFFPGKIMIAMTLIGLDILLSTFIYLRRHYTGKSNVPYAIVYASSFISILGIIIQYIMPGLALYEFIILLVILSIYMLSENPDLYIISDLKKMNLNITKSKTLKTDILSSMSNEIQVSTKNIELLVNNLNTKYLTVEESKKVSKEIVNHGTNLIETIDHILDLSKIQTGKETLSELEYSMGNIIKEIYERVEYSINKKGIYFKMDIAPNTPDRLFGDSMKLKQVISNILSNSIKYTDYGKIIFELKCDIAGTITNIHIKIADTGIGIKEEDFPKIFNSSNEDDAAGLGLAITKKYVEQLNGSIKFESTYLAGSVFYIDIPQDIVDASPIDLNTTTVKKEITYKNYNRQRIVIVDEDRLNRKVLIEMLKDYNFDITECDSGMDVLNSVKQGNIYDLILIDHQMAGLDGIDVLNALNVLKKYYQIPPVIMTTANAQSGKREFYLGAGFDDYLSKPISATALNQVILRYVKVKDERGYEVSEMQFENDSTSGSVESNEFKSLIDDESLNSHSEENNSRYGEFIPKSVQLDEIEVPNRKMVEFKIEDK